ncbi:DUF808 domain-containing protein [Shewanella surugensis]|uniref:DUF808 domain-containing protein n=1 Tax=Shewanella surugensis TaxID=212020 RepID=A0ABT0L6H1_9GAMM|nr:DUF808 domain-containing protein [Shewanella surugensis]MCL1123289.1 DUF808 domain-containing protein [Shewanella surugensis]
MAGASLLTLLDDIATILDDVATMSKMAARKTAGVLGDDLALNAQQVSGVNADRELPVVWAVAKGSFRNKCILVPLALLISAFIPWAVMPLLMMGGLYLCFEGVESVYHAYAHKRQGNQKATSGDNDIDDDDALDLQAYEAKKVKGAIRTDFVLSAEIIAITLGVVAQMSLMTQFFTLVIIAIVMTIGVYGIVAAIVRMDDAGLYLTRQQASGYFAKIKRKVGFMLLSAAPLLMRSLSVVGTIAMFMVGGGILTHGLHGVSAFFVSISVLTQAWLFVGPLLAYILPSVFNTIFGVLVGGLALWLFETAKKIKHVK